MLTWVGAAPASVHLAQFLFGGDSFVNRLDISSEWQLDVPPPTGERRAAVRYRCGPAALVTVHLPGASARLEAWACDVSDQGIGLNLLDPVEVGMPVVLLLGDQQLTAAIELTARVMHATQEDGGLWRIGCAFDRPLDPETLSMFL
jgi:hypothetical protein